MLQRCKHKWVEIGNGIDRGKFGQPPPIQQELFYWCSRCGALKTETISSDDDFRFTWFVISTKTKKPTQVVTKKIR